MARITYVKAAQQRYATVPVIDPETGQQKVTPVMRNGVQRTNKHGRPTTMRVTTEDRTRPLPLATCDYCRKPIEVGTPYKWIKPKSGPYGGRRLSRHAACPTWQVWDYSSSLSAQTARIAHDFHNALSTAETPDDVTSALQDAAQEVRDLADQKRESAGNIEDGFGHPTSTSEELADVADQLESWADDIEGATVPELPEPEPYDCPDCDGTGKDEGDQDADADDCSTCDGTGEVTPDEPTVEQIDEWRDEVEDGVSVVDECPV